MDDFSKRVVTEIEARGVLPRSRSHFLIQRSVFWTLAMLSVLVGAVALSVADYVFFDNEGVSAAIILESPVEGFIQTIPFVWLLVFGLFGISAYLSFRHTQTGYRYRALAIVATLVVVTVVLALLLNTFDFGQGVHYYLLNHTSLYDALIHSSDDVRIPF